MLSCWTKRHVVIGLVALLSVPLAKAAPASGQEPVSSQEAQSTPAVQEQGQNTDGQAKKPDSSATQPPEPIPDGPAPERPQVDNDHGQTGVLRSGSEQKQNDVTKPVGTAAAPYQKTTGVAASRPAGAVIAPAKQRRARTILIRVSLVVGAAVAVGTVVTLSHGSPARP